MKETKRTTGYVIRLSQYKDSDCIVTAIGEEGLFTFRARGVKKMTSKNAPSLLLLGFSSFLLEKNGNSWCLKEGTLLKAPQYKEELKTMAALSFIAEITGKFVMDEDAIEAFLWLDAALKAMETGFSILTLTLLLFARFIELEGYGLNVDECVYCRKKSGINGIDYDAGGFICNAEVSAHSSKRPGIRYLEIVRYAFRCSISDLSRVPFTDKECLEIINDLATYSHHILGINLKSLKPLLASL